MTDSQIAEFLAANGLDADSRLYRHSLPEYLSSTDDGGHRISANADPSEAVTNVYGQGHVV